MRRIIGAVLLVALAVCGAGCPVVNPSPSTQPVNPSPLVRVMELRAVYDASLIGLQIAINSGAIKDPATLAAIGEVRKVIESALDNAEAYAREGKDVDAWAALKIVNDALARYAELTRPVPVKRPIGRIPPVPSK